MSDWANRWAEDWTGADRRCGTCRWHDDLCYCDNSDSNHYVEKTDQFDDCCEEWEARE